ncbi:alpha-galactosidase [Pseudonocardia sp. TRM90224]|uniref:alpha-galactosidase n=1 Tax=Pseudonocardia sp. TRM90224 TaxID=2812678 RepID=UPI001E44D8D8|nr:alpha-galactosidase [Pseudonocardia sp. TRM90224]
MSTSTNIALRGGGVSLLLDVSGPDLPRVLHWGADVDLGDGAADLVAALVPGRSGGSLDVPWPLTVLPGAADGWPARPAVRGHRDGAAAFPRWVVGVTRATASAVTVEAADKELGLALTVTIALDAAGVAAVDTELRNDGPDPYVLDGITPVLPVPQRARELLDFTGRWARETSPQRTAFTIGTRARESWRGRPGHDRTPLLIAGTPGFGFATGEVWGVHVACGGDAVYLAERIPEGRAVLGGGELLHPGEVVLAPGESYAAPRLLATWSDTGLDGLSARWHAHVRARSTHPSSPRPLILNTWEAVYFDHDLARLTALADLAASVGVERFVLDDGWFHGRRDDTSSLGDWTVDTTVWPSGLHPLVEHVRGLGMQFGLWVEPEMISLDSDLARAHPDWVLAAPGRLPREYRHQHVLDLARPEAFAYVLGALDALVTEYDLDALKWDHNRDLLEAVHAGRPGVHLQTLAVQRLLDELRARHPRLEIESCSSGGARTDLATLARTDRIWASDNTDAIERQQIQRWTGLLLPPELVGAHIGATVGHTTGRTTDLGLRMATSLFGHAGIEWDLSAAPAEDVARLRGWAALYKELRGLLHAGVTVRADDAGEGALLHGVVRDGEGVYAYVRLATGPDQVPQRLLFPGLDANRRYRVRARPEAGTAGRALPGWLDPGAELPGAALVHVGLAAPMLNPGEAVIVHATPL